jgi:hypothetical protein
MVDRTRRAGLNANHQTKVMAGWIARRRHGNLALVLDLDINPGPMRGRVPDFFEGTGHRTAQPPTAVTPGGPGQQTHHQRERRHGQQNQQDVGHRTDAIPTNSE